MNVPNCTYVLSVVIHAKATMICDELVSEVVSVSS